MSLSILTPLNLELPLKPQLNRRFPHELHWRSDKPAWSSNIKGAFAHLYPGFMEGDCCLQCGAVPCPYDHETHRQERLKDLEFIKELAAERRGLKETITQLQTDMSSLQEKHRGWKAERKQMMEDLRVYESLWKEWERERILMEAEVKRLQGLNDKQQVLLTNYRKDQQRMAVMEKKIAELEQERDRLEEENKHYKKLIVHQSNEMAKMENRFKGIENELQESNAKVRTLTVQLDESTSELTRIRKQLWAKEAEIGELDQELKATLSEMDTRKRQFEQKEAQSLDIIRELRGEMNSLRAALATSEATNADLHNQINVYILQIERLKHKLNSDTRFRQFVDIKRQVVDLRSRNEALSLKVAEHENSVPAPVMKRSGKVGPAARRSRVTSAGIARAMQNASPARERRCSNASSVGGGGGDYMVARLHRPKSGLRTLVSMVTNNSFEDSEEDGEDDGIHSGDVMVTL